MNQQTAPVKQPVLRQKPYTFRQRLPYALLAAFVLPFTALFYGVLEIYANNMAEFDFALADIILPIILISLCAFVLLFAILAPLRGKAFDIVFALMVWLGVMGYLQGNFLNFGVTSLMADDVGNKVGIGIVILDLAIWVVTGVGAVLAVLLVRKHRDMVFIDATILLIMVLAVQAVNGVVLSVTTDALKPFELSDETKISAEHKDSAEESEPDDESKRLVLTEKDLYTVAPGKNVIIFLLDRFDAKYADCVRESDPTFFDRLDGFTYYCDNISTYPRTYPGVASIITGIENDFSGTASEYFANAYGNSPFLQTLKSHSYDINLYTESFYAYRDAAEMKPVANNVSRADTYLLTRKWELVRNVIGLSTYRYVPIAFKTLYVLSSESFYGFMQYDSAYPVYETQDDRLYENLMKNGLTVKADGNTYSFIHLDGCHPPYYLGENADNIGAESDLVQSAKGDMKIVYAYIDELKRLGLYDDATIVITGDHGDPVNDGKYLEETGKVRLTALFFKRSGDAGTPLAYSDAEVCQANLIPSILASAGFENYADFGKCYWEIPEDKEQVRRYQFLLNHPDTRNIKVVTYEVTGSGREFSHWKKVNEFDAGNLYR